MAAPATQDRNFRSFYYEKLCVRGVEEKKSIEILFKEKPMDVDKLSEFCLRFPVPAAHRPAAWKIILGVLPPFSDSHAFVIKQLEENYVDLWRALLVTGRINDLTPKPDQFLRMFLLSEGLLKLDDDLQFLKPDVKQFLSIAAVFCRLLTEDLDVYFLSVSFFGLTRTIVAKSDSLRELFVSLLARKDGALHGHLQRMGALHSVPVRAWFGCCFAGTLHDSSIERIWDKVIGGSCKILCYVACSVLTSSREELLALHSAHEVNSLNFFLSEETSDAVTTQALDAWKEQGEARRGQN